MDSTQQRKIKMEFWHLALRALIIGIVTGLGVFWILQAGTRQEASKDQEWSKEALGLHGLSDKDVKDVWILARQAVVRKRAANQAVADRQDAANRRTAEKMNRNKVWID